MNDTDLFECLVESIEAEYVRLGHSLGWRFLTSPKATVSDQTDFVFITLNPGGSKIAHEDRRSSCEDGSPYEIEKWGNYEAGESPLQKQICSLFGHLGWDFPVVLSGQFVPFRSPSWTKLPRQQESLEFGTKLWTQLLRATQPKVVISMGKGLRRRIRRALGTPNQSTDVKVGWGNVSAGLDLLPHCRFVSLPHLSRIRIIDREKSKDALVELFPCWQ